MAWWMIVIGIVVFNLTLASVMAYVAGAHSVKHEGSWSTECSHWICKWCGAGFLVPMSLLLGPTIVVFIGLMMWFSMLKNGGYLRNQPPENEHPGKRIS